MTEEKIKQLKFEQIEVWIAKCPKCLGYFHSEGNSFDCEEKKRDLKELIDDGELECDCND